MMRTETASPILRSEDKGFRPEEIVQCRAVPEPQIALPPRQLRVSCPLQAGTIVGFPDPVDVRFYETRPGKPSEVPDATTMEYSPI